MKLILFRPLRALCLAAGLAGMISCATHDHLPLGTPAGTDQREAVNFPVALRDHTLSNMRDHLLAIAQIQEALAQRNFDQAGQLAELRLGMSSLQSHGAHDVAQFMPKGMQEIGTAMHRSASRFATQAQDAAVTGDLAAALSALSKVTQACVACHAGYRLAP